MVLTFLRTNVLNYSITEKSAFYCIFTDKFGDQKYGNQNENDKSAGGNIKKIRKEKI